MNGEGTLKHIVQNKQKGRSDRGRCWTRWNGRV